MREIAVQMGATYTAEEVLRLYDGALDDIQGEIRKIKYNFGKRYGIDDVTAEYHISRAMEEDNLRSLIKLLEDAPNEQARRDILEYIHRDGLSVRAYSARIERYEQLKSVIYTKIKNMAVKETALVGALLKRAYKESYYGMIDDTAKGMDVGIGFAVLNDRAIDEAVNAKWHGKRFSERIWGNTDRLAEEAQELIAKAIISGESYAKTAQKLADRFGVDKFHAVTLVRTETAHIHAVADKKAYEDLGITEYKYLATLDDRTCETCGVLDGKVFKLSEAHEGVNYPSMHPRCRCTTTMNINYASRRARNPLSRKSEIVDGDLDYTTWKESLTPEQREALDLAKRKDSRKSADKLQYKQYQDVLGKKNVPSSFDKFQELKYNGDKTEYEELKGFFSYKKRVPEASLANYNSYKAIKEIIPNGSLRIPALPSQHTYILEDKASKRDPAHIMKRMKERQVTDDQVQSFVDNALFSITQYKGTRRVFYSAEGVTVLTRTTDYEKIDWIAKTTWSKYDFDDTTEKAIKEAIKNGK